MVASGFNFLVIQLPSDQLDADDGASVLLGLGAGVTCLTDDDDFTGADCGEAGIAELLDFFESFDLFFIVDDEVVDV